MGKEEATVQEPQDCLSQAQRYREVIFLSAGFAVSSSLLVIINKWALLYFPYGNTLTAIQFAVSALVAYLIGVTNLDEVDHFEWVKVLNFMPAVCMFYVSVATNLKLLEVAHVDTYIVVRSCVPIFTLGLEMLVLRTPWPGVYSFLSLVLIAFGAVCYMVVNNKALNEQPQAYIYAFVYLCAFTVDQVLIKKIVMEVKLTRWGLVLYNNTLALVLWPLGLLITKEYKELMDLSFQLNEKAVPPVVISCIFGLSISFFALNTRKALTATAFTVLGVVCKFATVAVNSMVWNRHSGPLGIFFVCICISGGIAYQQAEKSRVITPVKTEPAPSTKPQSGQEA